MNTFIPRRKPRDRQMQNEELQIEKCKMTGKGTTAGKFLFFAIFTLHFAMILKLRESIHHEQPQETTRTDSR